LTEETGGGAGEEKEEPPAEDGEEGARRPEERAVPAPNATARPWSSGAKGAGRLVRTAASTSRIILALNEEEEEEASSPPSPGGAEAPGDAVGAVDARSRDCGDACGLDAVPARAREG
jgi:hypothetical protein